MSSQNSVSMAITKVIDVHPTSIGETNEGCALVARPPHPLVPEPLRLHSLEGLEARQPDGFPIAGELHSDSVGDVSRQEARVRKRPNTELSQLCHTIRRSTQNSLIYSRSTRVSLYTGFEAKNTCTGQRSTSRRNRPHPAPATCEKSHVWEEASREPLILLEGPVAV